MGFSAIWTPFSSTSWRDRQTPFLLFSATQTKRKPDLASSQRSRIRLDLEQANSHSQVSATKLSVLIPSRQSFRHSVVFHSGLQSQRSSFLSSGKAGPFCLRSLPSHATWYSLPHLHGRQKQTSARLDITTKIFIIYSTLLHVATDVAARGLDFPAVDWVKFN